MHGMKFDMSGGAAVLEAFDTVAELGLELDLVAAIPSTENMPCGSAVRPGDVIEPAARQDGRGQQHRRRGAAGLGRRAHLCVRELGTQRMVDLATLTGAVVVALCSTPSACSPTTTRGRAVERAGTEHSGELAWRLPLHDEYRGMTKGTAADLTNAAAEAQGRHDLRRPLSWSSSSISPCPGPTWTSRAPPGTLAASTSETARAASARAC